MSSKSAVAAAAQLRRAGFEAVTARAGELDHQFTPESYLAFVSLFDDEDLFDALEAPAREELEADLITRLRALKPDGLRLRLPTVHAQGRRSSRA